MTSRSPNHPRPRPLSSTALPPAAQESPIPALKRKYSLDHGEAVDLPEWRDVSGVTTGDLTDDRKERSSAEVTEGAAAGDGERSPLLAKEDVNHNRPSLDAKEARRKVLKKQTSFESIGCDDNYFYDFFDRNCRPPTPAITSEETPPPSLNVTGAGSGRSVEENNNEDNVNTDAGSGASSKMRRNINGVRPRSWLTTTSTGKVEDPRRAKRRQTDPCGKDFLSNYERALSSLLYQPYECRSEGPSTSTSTTFDDSDVGYWLGGDSSTRWRAAERRGAGVCGAYQNESSESSSSVSSSSSSLAEFIRGKPWGDCKDPSSSSIRALLTDWRPLPLEGVSVSDLDASLPREPTGALATGSVAREGERQRESQSAARHGGAMLVTVGESDARGRSDLPSATTTTTSVQCEEVSVCYRAVPATVAAVPSIPCSSNVSNVRIVQAVGSAAQRTFTSTEAQTDDVIVDAIRPAPAGNPAREQRRRERRERRHQRRLATHLHQPSDPLWQTPLGEPLVDRLPDILNSHMPPPYTTLPLGLPPPIAVTTVPGSPPPPPPPPQPPGLRFPFAIVPAGRRRSRLSPHFTPEDEPKSCCGVAVSQTISIRWFIILIFLVGICCAVVGTILGAMKATGREHLTVSLLMIGVGVVLVAVSGVAWRLTAQDAPSCRALLGLATDDSSGEPNRRFVPRLPPSYGRPHHPYAAMMYPEFQYRAPPPSYQASMQEYRLRLLLLDRHSSGAPATTISPPPTYRSQAGSLLRAPIGLRGREMHTPSQSEYSRPPSYRSRTSSRPDAATAHSREPSDPDPGQAVNVITVHPHIIKLAPSPPLPAKNGKDSNMVTIVQTGSEPTGPVIVTISGQESDPQAATHSGMEILAHL